MNQTNRAVLAASGGLDSTSLLLNLLAKKIQVHLLSFRYGQKHSIEIDFLSRNIDYLKKHGFELDWQIVDLSTLGPLLHSALTTEDWKVPTGHYEQENMKETVVPNRNAIFASICYAWALSLSQRFGEDVRFSLGVHSGDHAIYPDCRPEFYQALLKAFAIGNWGSERVRIDLPFLNFSKTEILQDALRSIEILGLDFQRVYSNTITSYAPDSTGISSGMTGSDVERILAFANLGLVDPLPYGRPWNIVVDQARRFEKTASGSKTP